MCVSLDISILIVSFGDQACACRVCRFPYELSETNLPPVSLLFDELCDNNALDDGLYLSSSVTVNEQILEVILMLGNDAIFVACQLNAH